MCNKPLKTKGSLTIVADEDAAPLPLDLLLVVDVSGSMEGEGISVLEDSIIHILNDLMRPEDRIAVITFNSSASIHSGWSGVDGTVAPLSAGGGTNFGAAINQVLSFLGSNDADGSRAGVVLFLSDGHGQKASDDNVRSIPDFGFTMHTIGVTNGANPVHLEQMAELARGHYCDAPGFADVKKSFASIFNYGKTIVYSAPELSIDIKDGAELSNIIQSPQGLNLADKLEAGRHSLPLGHMIKNTRMEVAYDVSLDNVKCDKVNDIATFSLQGSHVSLTVRGTSVETELFNAPINNDVTLITLSAKATTAIKKGDVDAQTRAITKLEELESSNPNATTRAKAITQATQAGTIGEKMEILGKIQADSSGKTKVRDD
jgi:hypothetical protein